MIKGVLKIFGVILFVLIAILLINTWRAASIQPEGERILPAEIDENLAATRLSASIRYKTISAQGFDSDSAFSHFHQYLWANFPTVFNALSLKKIGNYSMLLKWRGKDESLDPVLFMGHQDVVPVEQSSAHLWEEEPFGGAIKNGIIWGRGSIDDKATVLGLLEATEALLAQGYAPNRTIYLFFGEDEEVGGKLGAMQLANYCKENNIHFKAISDEGSFLTQNIVPGIKDRPVALISTAEKGYLTLELTCNMAGGHSSMPDKENALTCMAAAVNRINNNQLPNRISGPLNGFLEYLGPEMPFVNKMAFANSTLLKGLIFNAYEKTPSGRALIHTTIAPTVLKSGIKDNVVPSEAKALVNMRILPGETVESCIAHITKSIDDDRIEIKEFTPGVNPSEVSDYKSEAFKELGLAIKDVYPDALVSPFLMLGATDSRHMQGLSKNIYKFMPVLFESEDLARFHGINERITVANYKKTIQIYAQCMMRWSSN